MVPRYLFTSKVATKMAAPAMTTTTMTAMAMRTLRMAYVLSRPRVRLDDIRSRRVCLRNIRWGRAHEIRGYARVRCRLEACVSAFSRAGWGKKDSQGRLAVLTSNSKAADKVRE